MEIGGATVFVVDDDEAVRTSLARLLRSAGWSVEAYASAGEFLDRPAFDGTGCVLLDVHMPGLSGPQLQEAMAERGLIFPLIFLTGNGDVPTSVRVMKRGAVDFLLKPLDDEALFAAIDQALRRHASERTHQSEQREIATRLGRLSAREREVMERVIRGSLNKQIAAELGIAEKTVKVHRARVMDKMEVRSVAELVRLCESTEPARLEGAEDDSPASAPMPQIH